MDLKTLAQLLVAIVIAGCSWFANTLWSRVGELDHRQQAVELAVVEIRKATERTSTTEEKLTFLIESIHREQSDARRP